MNQILEETSERIGVLQQLIENKRNVLKNAPEGLINVAHTKDRKRYYVKMNPKDKKRKYIKKNDQQLVQALIQKDYDEKVLHAAQQELNVLEQLQESYPQHTYEAIYKNLSADRQSWVQPVELPTEEFVEQWKNATYPQKPFHPDLPEYYTDKGERVRSKSEILIANTLAKHNIPYKYECPLHLKGCGTIHPDFTVLNVRTREEYYFEHMGMMDDAGYLDEALQRIEMYERNGIFPGKKLILTYETSKHPINLKNVERLIIHYLK